MPVSPCTLIRCWPPLAICAAGVKFLLLHLPLIDSPAKKQLALQHEAFGTVPKSVRDCSVILPPII
jgi:hypothetical protein